MPWHTQFIYYSIRMLWCFWMTPLNFPNHDLFLKKKVITLGDLIQKVENSIEIWHYEPEVISKNECHHWIFRTMICSWKKKVITLGDLIQKVENSIEIWHYEPEVISKNECHHWIFRTMICSWKKKIITLGDLIKKVENSIEICQKKKAYPLSGLG